jgi:NADH:ubiquinone oxidoreductase subunit 6 (subunit J)
VTPSIVAFWGVAVVLLASSLAVILTPNLFHAVLFLALALVATAAVFLLLESPFLSAVQLLLYAGGVVLFGVFAIMLTERLVGERIAQTSRWIGNGLIVGAGIVAAVLGFLAARPAPPPAAPPADAVTGIARALTGRFGLPFELLAVLLVAALLGAIHFARTEE